MKFEFTFPFWLVPIKLEVLNTSYGKLGKQTTISEFDFWVPQTYGYIPN